MPARFKKFSEKDDKLFLGSLIQDEGPVSSEYVVVLGVKLCHIAHCAHIK